jgi:chitodextrinase
MTRPFPSLFPAVPILLLTMLSDESVSSAQSLRDRLPPTAPTQLVVTATAANSVALAWNPSTDNSGRFNYIICCAGATVTVRSTETSHMLEGLQPGATHTLRVYAKDAAGNTSRPSNPVTVTVPGDLSAPTKPVVTVPHVGPTHASLTWSSTDDSSTLWYSIYVDGQPVGSMNSRTGTVTCSSVLVPTGCIPLDQRTTYTITVGARDADGNESPLSDPVFVTTAPPPSDQTPPAPPRNVTVDNGSGPLIVSWEPSTDNVCPRSLIRYDVYFNGELGAVVVGGTSATLFESSLDVGDIKVIAVDTADNESVPGTI